MATGNGSLARNVSRLAHLDLPGAGQVYVTGTHCYIGHIPNPQQLGTTILDIADPFRPREIGFFEPDPPEGCALASSNDVTMDSRGLLYLIDRQRGVDIIETSVF